MEAHPVRTYETSLTAAREAGVTALFGEKYGEVVRVVDADEFSQELCGGTHVKNTAEIGLVKIVSEGGVGANLRRIEAVTSYDALAYLNGFEAAVKATAATLKCPVGEVPAKAETVVKQVKELERAAKKAAQGAGAADADAVVAGAVAGKGGFPVVIARADGLDMGGMRNKWDVLRVKLPESAAVVLYGENDGKPVLMAAATDAAVAA